MDKNANAGGTVSSNGPVGAAGNPASTDASSKGMPFGRRGKAPDQKKSGAIARRIEMMNKKGKK